MSRRLSKKLTRHESVSSDICTPWKNGHYLGHPGMMGMLLLVEGGNFTMFGASGKPTQDDPNMKGTLTYGAFGDAHPDVETETGKSLCNVEISAYGGLFKVHAVLSDDRKRLTFYGMAHAVDFFEWMSEEEVAEYLDLGDPVDAPPNHYKIQPENQGKLLWLSGAPGLGKSTSGHLMGKQAGWVYYEADCFINHLNPYIPPDALEPTLAMMSQNFLKGVPQQRIDDVAEAVGDFMAFIEGKEYNFENVCRFYSAMSVDIANEQKRIGGDFVVAQAVPTRAFRDHIRTILPPNLIFGVIHMSKEDQMARIKERHGDADKTVTDMLTKMYDLYEPAAEDEPNAIHLLVTKDMNRDDVVAKILQMMKNY